MKIELDQETLKSVVSEAIFTSLTEAQRQVMITSALSYLMTPQSSGYGSSRPSTTPIQEAFNHAVGGVANRIASDMLTNDPEISSKIKGLIEEAVAKIVGENRANIIDKVANAIAEGLTKKSDY